VELCGDFNQEVADQIRLAIKNKAEVKFVSYDLEELKKLEKLDSDENYAFIIMDEGLELGKHLNKVNFIELSSAFDQQKALSVIKSIDAEVPVGYAR